MGGKASVRLACPAISNATPSLCAVKYGVKRMLCTQLHILIRLWLHCSLAEVTLSASLFIRLFVWHAAFGPHGIVCWHRVWRPQLTPLPILLTLAACNHTCMCTFVLAYPDLPWLLVIWAAHAQRHRSFMIPLLLSYKGPKFGSGNFGGLTKLIAWHTHNLGDAQVAGFVKKISGDEQFISETEEQSRVTLMRDFGFRLCVSVSSHCRSTFELNKTSGEMYVHKLRSLNK